MLRSRFSSGMIRWAMCISMVFFYTGCFSGRSIETHLLVPAVRTFPLVMIDPGHGGKDPGAKATLPLTCVEKTLTLYLGKKTFQCLRARGVPVSMTREDDRFVSLEDRVKKAGNQDAGLFVSIHCNAAKSRQAEGIEIFYDREEGPCQQLSKALAERVLKEMVKATQAVSRGVKKSGLYVVKNTTMPAILIETGFLTHPKESRRLTDPLYLDLLAFSIAEGVYAYLVR